MSKSLQTICIVILLYANIFNLNGQCSVTSSDGYTVTVTPTPTALIKSTTDPNSCQSGYGYEVAFNYTTTFSGSMQPMELYDLQINFKCGSNTSGQSLLRVPGSYSAITYNQYRSANDCATSTFNSIGCLTYDMIISGPGLSTTKTCAIAILPVTLTHFDVKYQKNTNTVSLNWSTALEEKSSHFEILRSSDGINFNRIGQVKSHEDSQLINSYEFVDNHFNDAITYYYQLKMVDLDNSYEMSKIISVQTSNQEVTQVIVSPNPGKNGIFNVFIPTELNSNSNNIEVYNQNMQLILGQDNTDTRVDLSNFANGIYILKVGSSTTKLVKLD
jgi:hypothetical protein